jgi:uncharacterized phage protein gp47/JayE
LKEKYNEILNNMRTAYFEECGFEPAPASDLELRFKAVASEIFSAYSFAEFVLKQGFPQTATGEYLDKHARLRGLERKTATCAQGRLLFSVEEPLEADVLIPAATVCSSAERPFVQFATTQAATISAGETSVLVPAQAIAGGAEFNAPAGEITVMVNPPEYISSVTNPAKMEGGFDDENDRTLRQRILDSYSGARLSVDENSVRETLIQLNGILDARVYNSGSETVNICVKLGGNATVQSVESAIYSRLGFISICKMPVDIIEATPFEFNINASIKIADGFDENEVCSAAEALLSRETSSMQIGKNISSAQLAALLYGIEGITLAEVCAVDTNGMPFSCPSNSYLVPGSISVAAYE